MRCSGRTTPRALWVAFVLAGTTAHAQEPPAIATILERAGRYVVDYEKAFSSVIAEETYTQWTGRGSGRSLQRRTTRADLVFVSSTESIPWTTYRDVYEVDGQKVHEREARLERIFLDRSGSAQERLNTIMRESARYNIGRAVRTINIPTLALLFLHPESQRRFRFERKGQRFIHGLEGVEIEFAEIARPTLVNDGVSEDLPALGHFWINPDRGTVLRSEVTFRFEPRRAVGRVTTEYQPEAGLGIWVPGAMREAYEDLPGSFARVFGERVEATALYSRYRRFSVTTEEQTALPSPDR